MMSTLAGRVGIGVCSALCALTFTGSLMSGSLSTGCGLASRSGRETGTLRVLVKHKPFLAEWAKAAKVTVARIEVRQAENNDDDWIVIQEGEQVINLLETGSDQASVLASADVASGQYKQMRLICTKGSIAVDDDRSLNRERDLPLNTLNGAQAAIHLDCEFAVSAGDQTTVLINSELEEALQAMADNRQPEADQVAGFHPKPPVTTAR